MISPLAANEPALHVAGITKTFASAAGAVSAIAGIEFELGPREFVSILGPSGCGKTTLLRMIAGLEPPSAGNVLIGGRPVWHAGTPAAIDDGAGHHVAIAFQEPRLFPWFTVEDNVALPLRINGVAAGARSARARALCALVGLTGFEAARPHQLSGGMRQRASLARALVTEPRILLLDEPFGALDAMTRDAMNLELQRICASAGAAAILITHSIAEAVFLGDRVIVLSPRPSRVHSIHAVPLPRPRAISLQETTQFQSLVRAIRQDIAGYPA